MRMQLAERIFVKENATMADLCRKQTTVYNQALWYLRQEYFNLGDEWKIVIGKDGVEKRVAAGFLTYYDLTDKAMLRWKQCFRDANPTCAANTIKRACDAWKAYWAALKAYQKNPSLFTGKPKMPNYKDRFDKSPVFLTYIQFSVKNNELIFANVLGLPAIPCHYPDQKTSDSSGVIKQVRIIPNKNKGYWVEIVHEVEVEAKDRDKTRVMAIDLGLVRIATVVDNLGNDPISFSGGPAIEINHWYNKELARLRQAQICCDHRAKEIQRKYSSDKDSLTNEEWREWKDRTKYTTKMKDLTDKRNNQIKAFYHRLSRLIVNEAVKRDIGIIVIGHNPLQKQGLKKKKKLNDTNRQKFTQQPIFKLIGQIRYKAEMESITVIEVTEEFTSKASFLDKDILPDLSKTKKKLNGHSDVSFSGKRVKRGLYKSARGIEIQADVNGAYNILRKAFSEAGQPVEEMAVEGDPIRAVRLHPRVLDVKVSSGTELAEP